MAATWTNSHIAVLGSCKVGNFVASLPVRLLRRRYPKAQIDFWGSEATADFEQALCVEGQPSIGESPGMSPLATETMRSADWRRSPTPLAAKGGGGLIDLAINCDGFNPLTQTLTSWLQPIWVAGEVCARTGGRHWHGATYPNSASLLIDWDSPAFSPLRGTVLSNYIAELLCRMAFLSPTPTIWLRSPCLGETTL